MSAWVLAIHGIALAISVSIDTAIVERAERVWRLKTHQSRVVSSVAIAEQVAAREVFKPLPVEPHTTIAN